MFCRGIFKEDGLEYEGLIKSIESTNDGQYAVVEFIGYGNQECLWLQDLLESNGEDARQKQNKEANGEIIVNGQDLPDAKVTTVVLEHEQPRQDTIEKSDNNPPTWQEGKFCRGIFKQDGLEYEGIIKSIESTDDGQYALVEFVGYGDEQAIWLQDLMESLGEETRQKQIKEANGETFVDGKDVQTNGTEPDTAEKTSSKEKEIESGIKKDTNSSKDELHVNDDIINNNIKPLGKLNQHI